VDALTGESRTFCQILTKSLNIAKHLQDRGIGKGSVVAVCSENSLDFVLPILASYFIGELCHAMNISKPCIIFSSTRALQRVDEVSKHVKELKEIVTFGNEQHQTYTPFSSFLKDNSTTIQMYDENPDELVAVILCSSGTTGMPKGVMLTQKNILAVFTQMM
ncbi:Luciferin 4-monooxygenase, partial [Blattella germanica]